MWIHPSCSLFILTKWYPFFWVYSLKQRHKIRNWMVICFHLYMCWLWLKVKLFSKKELKGKREFCFAFFCYVFNVSNNVQNRTVSHFDSTYNLLSISDIKAMKGSFCKLNLKGSHLENYYFFLPELFLKMILR